MCVMLAGLTGFDERTNENKVFAAAVRRVQGRDRASGGSSPAGSGAGGRGATRRARACTPTRVADCPPGETRTVRGWLSFYEGGDIDAELARLKKVVFE